ncbi:MAG TPA: hypothetical protein PKA77_07620 [Chitinophagaceae bacterium]|jgi:hypothetical protein|nr:hypothetical protein [Chitinophagaceae bacterium]HMU60070.1 hypothetical protein [Chitinophagaceae bacterium]
MTFLEAVYGSQYYELQQKGKDGNKARLNGNLVLAAFIILFLFTLLLLLVNFVPGFEKNSWKAIRNIFGSGFSGRTIGRLVALPLMVVIYLICAFTVGSKKNFDAYAQKFVQYPDEVKKKAPIKMLLPFLLVLLVFLVMAFRKM